MHHDSLRGQEAMASFDRRGVTELSRQPHRTEAQQSHKKRTGTPLFRVGQPRPPCFHASGMGPENAHNQTWLLGETRVEDYIRERIMHSQGREAVP